MSKKAKKRNKRYQGDDAKHLQVAASDEPVVRRYTAVDRGPVREWWTAKKRPIRIGAIISGVVLFIGWLLYEFIQIIF